MRAFVAIPPSNDAMHAVHELQEYLRKFPPFADFRWIPSSNVHMTLRFLGDISEEEAAAAASALDAVCARGRSFSFPLECLGVFPRPRNPGVLWAGSHHSPVELLKLAESLAGELESAGFPAEDRLFRPHLTLARRRRNARSLKGVNEALKEAEKKWLSPPILVPSTEAVLFRSDLRPGGAVYQAVRRVPFLN